MRKTKFNFQPNSIFLVTGGAGFIGSHICEKLLNLGYKVRCLDDFSTGKQENISSFLENPNFELIRGSICDFDTCLKACYNIDYISHQAAWGSVPKSINQPLAYEENNIKGTLNMLEAAVRNNVKVFVYASSSSVYGDNTDKIKHENNVGNVLSPYALTKKTCEEYAKIYTNLYGLATIGLRYFNVFGPRQNADGLYSAVIPNFIKNLLSNKPSLIYGDGLQSRDFTFVENVVFANLKGLECQNQEVFGKVYNVACNQKTQIKDLYFQIAKYLQKDIPPIYKPTRKGDILNSQADVKLACQCINYKVLYTIEQALPITIDWYLNNLNFTENEN